MAKKWPKCQKQNLIFFCPQRKLTVKLKPRSSAARRKKSARREKTRAKRLSTAARVQKFLRCAKKTFFQNFPFSGHGWLQATRRQGIKMCQRWFSGKCPKNQHTSWCLCSRKNLCPTGSGIAPSSGPRFRAKNLFQKNGSPRLYPCGHKHAIHSPPLTGR